MFNFKYDNTTGALPQITTGSSITSLGTYGSLIKKFNSNIAHVLLAPYKDANKTVVYSEGPSRYYYSANYPSIHCRKNNTNYSCCNNYQDYRTSMWTFDYAYGGNSFKKTVEYAENSYLGSSYNKYTQQSQLAPYGMVTPTRSGYTFKGWNTSKDDTGTEYKSASTMRSTGSDATFYALWARIDAGTYGDQQFLDRLAAWFGGLPAKNEASSVKISNHRVDLLIGASAITVSVGTTLQLSHPTSNSGFDQQWKLVIDGVAYEIRWANWAGQGGGPGTIVVSNGWLTDKYDSFIVKGTYTPSAFKNLIQELIPVNGSRTVAQGFTAIVNRYSVHVPAGGTIYYRHPYPSNPNVDVYYVGFGSYNENAATIARDPFVDHRTYCVYNSSSYAVYNYFNKYMDYPITITSDIMFN